MLNLNIEFKFRNFNLKDSKQPMSQITPRYSGTGLIPMKFNIKSANHKNRMKFTLKVKSNMLNPMVNSKFVKYKFQGPKQPSSWMTPWPKWLHFLPPKRVIEWMNIWDQLLMRYVIFCRLSPPRQRAFGYQRTKRPVRAVGWSSTRPDYWSRDVSTYPLRRITSRFPSDLETGH
jgi:hypothetical protein